MTRNDAASLQRTLRRDDVLADPTLSLFQKVLLVTDGSVTELLCIYTGQTVRANKLAQAVRTDARPLALDCPPDTPLLHRQVMLVAERTPLVFAESAFILDRLSERARHRLLDSDAPIGQLWKEERTEMYREIVDIRLERHPGVAAHFDRPADTLLLSRTYLLFQGGTPLGLITEKFPDSHFR